MTYARNTKVPVDRSRAEVEKLLRGQGAEQLLSGWEHGRAVIGFRLKGRYIRMTLPLSSPNKRIDPAQVERQRWRAMLLVLKAKFEAISAGIVTMEDEFLSYTVMPDNQTVGTHLLPAVAEAYKTGKLPPLLPAAASRSKYD